MNPLARERVSEISYSTRTSHSHITVRPTGSQSVVRVNVKSSSEIDDVCPGLRGDDQHLHHYIAITGSRTGPDGSVRMVIGVDVVPSYLRPMPRQTKQSNAGVYRA